VSVHRQSIQLVGTVLFACLLAGMLPQDAAAQSRWQKIKRQFLQQACNGGDQQACQQLSKMGQAPLGPAQKPQAAQAPQLPAGRTPPGQLQQSSPAQNNSGPLKSPTGTKVVEQVMAPLQADAKFFISPHGVHVATVENAGSRFVVYYDGVPGPKFDEILNINNNGSGNSDIKIAFSPDGKRYAYCARSGTDFIVMVDGKELMRNSGPPEANGSWPCSLLGFTSNSQHSFYGRVVYAPPNGGYGYAQFWFDGKSALDSSDLDKGIQPVFSPDGNHYAYIDHDPARTGKWSLVIDGRVAPYLGGNPQWSADSQHVYTTIEHNEGQRHSVAEAMLDGKPFLQIAGGIDLNIPPQGNMVVAHVTTQDPPGQRLQFLMIDGTKMLASEVRGVSSGIGKVTFSPDGKHYAAPLKIDENRQAVLLDGKRLQEYHVINQIAFTADSSKVIYTANDSTGKSYVDYGDQESNTCFADFDGAVAPIAIAPAGNRVGAICGLTGGAPTIFLDGKMLPIVGIGGSYPSFTPDGKHFVYVAAIRGGGARLVIDEIEQKASSLDIHQPVPYVISPDSEHIAAPSGGNGLFLDGKFIVTGRAPQISTMGFTPDNKHLFWAEGMPGNVLAIYVDGKMVTETVPAVNSNFKKQAWWDVSPDGRLSILGQDNNSLKRITITPSPETSVASLGGGGITIAGTGK
jgi:WD40 repeat protein